MTIGESGATVMVDRRNGLYRKVSDDPRDDLVGEGARLSWLREHGIPAAEVIDCRPGLLVTAEVPGVSAAEKWPEASRPRIVDALADMIHALHALPIAECPFDRRLSVVMPEALAADVDLDDVDDERTGWTRDELVAQLISTQPSKEDLVVCHGDLSLPNVMLDPETWQVSGFIDAGRLGVADRWADLALVVRSLTEDFDPRREPRPADRFLNRYGIELDPLKNDFYRLLDEFF
ncbi:APH(3') family aminoglycoside O-phosphotransferase [Actinoplanes sp. NPDC048796]|uniref:APH(3') family aminoglycoside O-phosphotransferase n=1 Tax=Actinoplanes sp. NPDC048796 TaxID=3155640 RepID=UPI0033CD86FE